MSNAASEAPSAPWESGVSGCRENPGPYVRFVEQAWNNERGIGVNSGGQFGWVRARKPLCCKGF